MTVCASDSSNNIFMNYHFPAGNGWNGNDGKNSENWERGGGGGGGGGRGGGKYTHAARIEMERNRGGGGRGKKEAEGAPSAATGPQAASPPRRPLKISRKDDDGILPAGRGTLTLQKALTSSQLIHHSRPSLVSFNHSSSSSFLFSFLLFLLTFL